MPCSKSAHEHALTSDVFLTRTANSPTIYSMTATFPLNNNKMKLVFTYLICRRKASFLGTNIGVFGWLYGTQLIYNAYV